MTLEQKMSAVQFPDGPEDKIIAAHSLTWDQLKEFAERKDWPLASKLAQAAIDLGLECEHQVGRAVFWEADAQRLKEHAGLDKSAIVQYQLQVANLTAENAKLQAVAVAARECLKFHSSQATHTKNSWTKLNEALECLKVTFHEAAPVLPCLRCGCCSIVLKDCETCGGEGVVGHDCGEDTCVCLDQSDNVLCGICGGRGQFQVCAGGCDDKGIHPDPEDQ